MIANRHAVEFALNPYWSRVENLIQLVLVDGGSNLYSYVNVSEFQSTGFTITASVRSLNWRVVTGFNQNWNQYAGTTMPESRLTFQSAFQFWKHFSISSLFNYTIQGNQLVNNGGTYTFRSIPAHVLWDCTLTYQHRKTKGPSLQLGVKNLLNVQNVTFAGGGGIHTTGNVIAIAPGRRYVSSITWQF
jgi:outer membrane receptor for ferrienterochelin and colicin